MLEPSHATAIARRYGLGAAGALEGPAARGQLGQVWRLTTARGRFAVKDAFFEVSAASAARDAAYQDVVRSRGVPMPAVVRTTDGAVLADVDGSRVRVYEWVDVLARDRLLDPEAVGRLVARIHSAVVPTDEPVDAWYVDPVGAEAWAAVVDRLRRADAPFADDLARVVPEILSVEQLLTPAPAEQVCHQDLWADNVLRTPGGGLAVLDWENCGPNVPARELVVVTFEFGAADPRRMRAVHTAYVEAGGPARVRDPGDVTMLVAQTGHIAQEACRRWLASETDEERAHNEAWARELIDDPITEATVDRLLAATRDE